MMSVSAQTAADFGAVRLPQGVDVLGVKHDSGRDMRYRLALRMNDAQLTELLGQFREQPRRSDIPKSTPVIAGPALSSAPDPRYLQDQIGTAEHGQVTREVVVDERSPSEIYVHLAFYTT
jgi:hypothetical protein